jgi:hypothetical protein
VLKLPPFPADQIVGLMVSRSGAVMTISFAATGGRSATHAHNHVSEADAATTMSLFAAYVATVFRREPRAA